MHLTKHIIGLSGFLSILMTGCAGTSSPSAVNDQSIGETTGPVSRHDLAQQRMDVAQPQSSTSIGKSLDSNGEWEPVVESGDIQPPDPNMAVGSSHVVVATNPSYVVSLKTTPTVAAVSWDRDLFWEDLVNLAGAIDPYVVYDSLDDAFFMVAFEARSIHPGEGILLVAACDQDPTDRLQWNKFEVSMLSIGHQNGRINYGSTEQGFLGIDRPSVTVGADYIYVTFWGEWCDNSQPFCFGGATRVQPAIVSFLKEDLLTKPTGSVVNGNGVLIPEPYRTNALISPAFQTTTTNSDPYWVGIDPDSPERRRYYDPPTTSPNYRDPNAPYDQLTLFRVTNPQSAPMTLDAWELSVTLPYFHPYSDKGFTSDKDKGARQSTSSTPPPLALTDARILSAAQHHNTIWAAHHVRRNSGTNNGTVIRWYRIGLDSTPLVIEENTIDLSDMSTGVQAHSFYPSIAANANGIAAMTFNVSSEDTSIPVQVWRQRLTPAGDAQLLKTSDVNYRHLSGNPPVVDIPQRWGDYSATVVDPSDESIFWGVTEWVGDNNTPTTWNTWAYSHEYCYADCDLSTGEYVLDTFDFLCFQDAYIADDPYACDCDTSTGLGVCDTFDFLCFQNAFVTGCN